MAAWTRQGLSLNHASRSIFEFCTVQYVAVTVFSSSEHSAESTNLIVLIEALDGVKYMAEGTVVALLAVSHTHSYNRKGSEGG